MDPAAHTGQGANGTMATITRLPTTLPPTREATEPTDEPPRLPCLARIAKRRWPVLVLLPLLALVIAGVNYGLAPRSYTATGQLTVTDQSPVPGDPQYAQYYRNLSSEAATDDLIRIVPGSRFAGDVSDRLRAQGFDVPPKEVQGALEATRVFRVLTINATANDHGRAVTIARAALDTLTAKSADYFPNRPVRVDVTNSPTQAAAKALRAQVIAAGTVIAALLAAVAIALAMELVDTRLHDRREVEELLGLPVVGAVPRRADRSGRSDTAGKVA